MKKTALVLVLLTALVGSLAAQEAADTVTPQTEADIVFGTSQSDTGQPGPEPVAGLSVWSFVSMVLVLGGVVAAIYGLFYLLKRMSGRNLPDNDLIRIVSTKSLSSTRGVHLLSLGKRYLLVGSAENSVNLIAEIDDKETRDEIDLFLAREEPSEKRNFRTLIGGLLSGGKEGENSSVSSSTAFLKNQGSRIKDL